MYEDWLQALCDLSHVDLKQASVFELACNSGYLLFSLTRIHRRTPMDGVRKAEGG